MKKYNKDSILGRIGRAERTADLSTVSYSGEDGNSFCIRVLAAGTVKVIYDYDAEAATESTLTFAASDVGTIFPVSIRTIVFDSGVVTQETSYQVII